MNRSEGRSDWPLRSEPVGRLYRDVERKVLEDPVRSPWICSVWLNQSVRSLTGSPLSGYPTPAESKREEFDRRASKLEPSAQP